MTQQSKSVHFRHIDIGQNQIRLLLQCQYGLLAIGSGNHLMPFQFETVDHGFTQLRIIFHDQNNHKVSSRSVRVS